jgi:putative intracellular protease/amidase
MAKVLVICSRQFNGHELKNLLTGIRRGGHQYTLASTDYVLEDEVTHNMIRCRLLVQDATDEGFDALAFSSGDMRDSEGYWTNPHCERLVKAFNDNGRPIAAICITVPAIRWAVSGKTITCFPLVRSKDLLRQAGATLSPLSLCRDQNIVTAEHQMASQMWAEEFVALIDGKPKLYNLIDSGYSPPGIPRKPIPVVEDIRRKQLQATKLFQDDWVEPQA